MDKKQFLEIIWAYIRKHGTIINNQNLDYVVEQALKEYGESKNEE